LDRRSEGYLNVHDPWPPATNFEKILKNSESPIVGDDCGEIHFPLALKFSEAVF
jgi:hypothetical protein